MKLISMTDFVLEIAKERARNEEPGWDYTPSDFNKALNYANFLKKPLKLEMFVPCDDEGNVLEEPIVEDEEINEHTTQFFAQYQFDLDRAKEKVLFEGFNIEDGILILPNGSRQFIKYFKVLKIEDLTYFEPMLTRTAIKQIQP